jgi:tetratricopeptide (TPR) repeat protein
LGRGDLETADSRFSLAIEYSPRFVEALTNLGLVELQRGNFERARDLLSQALKANPDVAQPHHGLGVLAEREGLRELAMDYYRDALSVDPGFLAARANLARLLFNTGQLEQARIEFSKLIEAGPDDPAGYVGLAESLLRLGRTSEADSLVERNRKRFPDSGELDILWCRVLLHRGHPEQALQRLRRWVVGRDDLSVTALSWAATAELLNGRPRLALTIARRAVALKSDDPVAAYAMAMALSRLGDQAAEVWLKRALLLAPGHPQLEKALQHKNGRRTQTSERKAD